MSHVMNTYARLPVAFSHGQGSRITDTEGKEYLDALSGIAVSTLGHAHPKLVAAIAARPAVCCIPPISTALLARNSSPTSCANVPACRRCSSAIPAARPTRRRSSWRVSTATSKGIESPTIIVMEKAFHGRTMATLSATGNRKAQAGFEPLVHGFVRVPYDDLEAIKTVAEHNNNIVAVMLEIIQGEGGIHLADEYQKGCASCATRRAG
jgi:acetylornithine/N-succinyldiaminopimelate aminotransferase